MPHTVATIDTGASVSRFCFFLLLPFDAEVQPGGEKGKRFFAFRGREGNSLLTESPNGLQRQRNHSFDTDFAYAYKDIG
jgi:hypothetical protein